MANITSPFPPLAFAEELDSIDFERSDDDADSFRLSVYVGQQQVFSNLMAFDASDCFTLDDFAGFLSPFLGTNVATTLRIVAGRDEYSSQVLPSRLNTGQTAAEWTARHFLHLWGHRKTTCYGLTERLSAWLPAGDVTVRVRLSAPEGQAEYTHTVTHRAEGIAQYALDWREYRDFITPERRESFVADVEMGGLRMVYHATRRPSDAAVFEYTNAFGMTDTMLLCGITRTASPTRTTARQAGYDIITNVENGTSWEAHTLPLLPDAVTAFEDFLYCPRLRLAGTYDYYLISGQDFKAERDAHAYNRARVTLTASGRNPLALTEAARIFDASFDDAYN